MKNIPPRIKLLINLIVVFIVVVISYSEIEMEFLKFVSGFILGMYLLRGIMSISFKNFYAS